MIEPRSQSLRNISTITNSPWCLQSIYWTRVFYLKRHFAPTCLHIPDWRWQKETWHRAPWQTASRWNSFSWWSQEVTMSLLYYLQSCGRVKSIKLHRWMVVKSCPVARLNSSLSLISFDLAVALKAPAVTFGVYEVQSRSTGPWTTYAFVVRADFKTLNRQDILSNHGHGYKHLQWSIVNLSCRWNQLSTYLYRK